MRWKKIKFIVKNNPAKEEKMDVRAVPPEIWSNLITGKMDCDFDFLGLKFLIARLRMKVKVNPDKTTLQVCSTELRDYFKQTEGLPVVQKDFAKILKLGGIA
jgi:hypothetical protein